MNWMTHALVSKAPKAVNETGNNTQLPRTPAKSDWCDFDVIIFLYFLSCDKQVHVNFWGTYFQQDANRWQTFSLRQVREHPECLCSLPPPKTTSSANQASGLLSSVLERDNIEQVRMLHQVHQGIWPLKDTMFLSVFDRQTRVIGNGHMSGAWDN